MTIKNPLPANRVDEHADQLSDRLESIEAQLGQLTELLNEQVATRKRRRRQITIRFLLASFVGFALLFAWFGRAYHQSRLEAANIDRLASQSVFVMYSPRESVLVSLLPGDPANPPQFLDRMFGVDFFRAVTNVSTHQSSPVTRDKNEIIASIASLSQLRRLRLTKMQLTMADLVPLGQLRELQSLDIANTTLDAGSMPWLHNVQLRWLNASHTHLSDQVMYNLSHCPDLQKLNLERTAISDVGLKHLYSMSNLRYLNLKRCALTGLAVKQLSLAIPDCVIDWEPLILLPNGQPDVAAIKKGRVQYGNRMGENPRASQRANAPLDSVPRNNRTFQQPNFMLDVY